MSILILKLRLCTKSEIEYLEQLIKENLLAAGVQTCRRLAELREESAHPPVQTAK